MPLLALVAAVAGCEMRLPWQHEERPRKEPAIVFSPNGEVLTGGALGKKTCAEAIAGWFARVDSNQDGAVDRAEFLADMRAQFVRMDADVDGFITVDEVQAYRQPYLKGENGDSKRLSLDGPDPVMSADANLDFRVSLAEFTALAEETFARLDADADGRLTADEAGKACGPSK